MALLEETIYAILGHLLAIFSLVALYVATDWARETFGARAGG